MLVLLSSAAHAFCGTYVGDSSSSLTNTASQIAIARSGTSTTLTMLNDVQGDLTAFGLVIPVPEGVDADNVRLADRAIFDRLQGYTEPRMVSYTCDDWYGISDLSNAPPASASSSGGGCGGGGKWYTDDTGAWTADTGGDTGVVIVDQFELGEYTAWVVDAQGSSGLMAWLDANGFSVDASTADVFQSYIDAGSQFLALRVDPERMTSANWLSPLQVGYDAEAWSLPIRMGAASSAGVQDLVVYALTDPEAGRVGISNYPESTAPESECLLGLPEDTALADWYEARFEETVGLPADPKQLAGQQGFGWVTEYGWGSGQCDPCTATGPFTQEDAFALGFPAHYGWYLTRLHLRYTPAAVTQDLSFYASGVTDPTQLRYVQRTWELEGDLPVCAADPVPADANPAACYSSEYWARKAEEGEPATEKTRDTSGCGSGAFALLLVPAALLRRRK